MDVNSTLSLDIVTEPSDPLITGMMAICNQQSPPGFKMEPGPGASASKAPVYKCHYCSWGTGRESLLAVHERTCQREQAQFKSAGLDAEQVKLIVVDTMKPLFAEFAAQLKSALTPAVAVPVPPEKKKRGRPKKDDSPLSHR